VVVTHGTPAGNGEERAGDNRRMRMLPGPMTCLVDSGAD